MKVSLFVSCEKQQELTDLEKVVVELKNATTDIAICLVDFSEFTGETLQITSELFDEIKYPKALFKKKYYKLSFIKKVMTIFYGVLILFSYTRKYQITHFMYGVPIVFFRAMNFVPFRKYKTFSYVRSTVVSDDVQRQRWPSYIRRLLNNINLTKPYIADQFFCIDDATTKYIESFYANQSINKVIKTGSIYSCNLLKVRNIRQDKSIKSGKDLSKICFITSAFFWHGDAFASNQQIILLNELSRKIKLHNIESPKKLQLLIKVHPRDSKEYYSILCSNGDAILLTEFDTSTIDESYCFASALSTLSYELKLAGYTSIYMCNNFFKNKYAQWYIKNCIEPLDVGDENLIKNIQNYKNLTPPLPHQDISPERMIMLHVLEP